MTYLFLCTIGPVQDFIASARRSRDLWYGSWMLNELSKAAAKDLADRYGQDGLIFPAPNDVHSLEPGSALNVANRIVALVSDDLTMVSQQVEAAIRKRLTELRNDAFGKVRGGFDRTLAERQVEDLVEYYWVGVVLAGDADYAPARDMAEALLSARKVTRNFEQFNGKPVPKSSLDSAHESVIPQEVYPTQKDDARQRVKKLEVLYHNYGVRRGEHLSGVDLVKRWGRRGKDAPEFLSTSHVAALPFMKMVDRVKGEGSAKDLLAQIRHLFEQRTGGPPKDTDGSLFYTSRLAEWVPDEVLLEELREEIETLLTNCDRERRPSPYYALLLADGDSMGKIINAQTDKHSHRRLSQVLSEFAIRVGKTIEAHDGVLVYAGGDDVLAYLPLHTVLACAGKLAGDFREQMKGFRTEEGLCPTLSAGIVVAHHLIPLTDVLNLARQAEKMAKNVGGKDALAVTVSKRGGADRTIVDKWDVLMPRLEQMIDFTRKKAISKGTAYELQELHQVLSLLSTEAIAQEAMRIVQRKRESSSDKAVSKKVVDQFNQWIRDDKIPVGNLAQEIIVATLFANAIDLADGRAQIQEEVESS